MAAVAGRDGPYASDEPTGASFSRRIFSSMSSIRCSASPLSVKSVVRSIEGRGPGHDHVEVQPTDQLQALYVVLAIARSEQRRHPRAVFENDGVSGEQDTMLSRIPEKRRRPACVAGDGYDLEVISEGMPLGERPVQIVGSRDFFLLVLVGIKRRTEGARDPRARRLGDPRFVAVVQVLPPDAAFLPYIVGLLPDGRAAVDEQVAFVALQKEATNPQLRRERQGCGAVACSPVSRSP